MNDIEELHIPCPDCGSSDALCKYKDGHSYCFSCLTWTGPEGGKEFHEDKFTYEYLPYRGISKDTYRFFNALTKIDGDGKPVSIGFKYSNDSYKIRTLDKKGFFTKGEIGKASLYGRELWNGSPRKTITITEGELDALSFYEVLRSPVVSVKSAATAGSDAGMERSWLNEYERIYLAFDGDEAGRRAASAVARLFDPNKVYDIRFPGGSRKDANDYLRNGERDELAQLWGNARRYVPEQIISTFSEFEKVIHEQPKTGVSYPWPTLNYMTYGIRTGESVLITAQEGVGKTEVMHAILHNLLTETKDAVGSIFLEEPKKRLLQAMAGIHLQRPVHLPDSGVSDSETFAAVQKVVREDERLHVYSHFGSDDPEVILDTIRFLVTARLCRYILLDHITMVVSGLGGDNERRALDYLSTRLEMMVKELDFALIVVSHVNDDGLTRGSRNISKIADLRIDLTRDIKNADPTIRRTTHLMVSKNRFCGRTGPAGQLLFDPKTYTLTEDVSYGLLQEPANDNRNSNHYSMAV
jgi:twinkle protein